VVAINQFLAQQLFQGSKATGFLPALRASQLDPVKALCDM
jgi:ABC-type lipoprotein release transport system permease subunit